MGTTIATPLVTAPTENFPVLNVANGIVPDEALAITCTLQFGPNAQAILIDLSESARKFNQIPIQGAFIDMSNSSIDMRLDNPQTGQSILAKASLQGYYNILSPMPAKFIAVLAGTPVSTLNITVILYNTVIESEVWGLTSGAAGPAGPQGPPGPTGATGPQGPAGPAGVIASVQNQGTLVTPARAILNFTGAGVTATDDSVNTRTNITIPGTPIATASVLGGVKIGTNVSVAGDGTISVPPIAAFQTPWLTSINGATNSLTNVNTVSANNFGHAGTTANPSVDTWSMNGLLRWRWATVIAESGSNTGTNLLLQSYADDGSTLLANPAISIIRSSGFVGIGPGSVQYQLDVRTPGSIASQVHIASTNTDAGAYLSSGGDTTAVLSAGAVYNGSAWIAKNALATQISQYNGQVQWAIDTGLTVGSSYTPTFRMTLQSNGLGIGMLGPTEKLDVGGGGIRVRGSLTTPVASTGGFDEDTANSCTRILCYGPNTTTLGNFQVITGHSDNTGLAMPLQIAGLNVAIGYGAGPPPGVTYNLQLANDSAAKPGTNTWTIASGAKVKRNVKRLKGGLDIINKLSPTEAEYNGKGGTPNGQRVVSLIAEEVRKVLPHTVTEDKDGNLGFNAHEVIFHLILAVQQLSKRLEEVTA